MTMRKILIPTVALLAVGIAFTSSSREEPGNGQLAAPHEKIDPAVQRFIDRADSASVLVLGTRQLLAFADGFSEATQRWEDSPRRELRAAMMDSL